MASQLCSGKIALLAAALAFAGIGGEQSRFQTLCDAGWRQAMTAWHEKTALVYGCPPERVHPSVGCVNHMFHWKEGGGYGAGMGDCALICGTALSGLVDRFAVLNDDETRKDAAKVARGVLNLAKLHGVRGFVARGICADDGRTICSLSSRDQFTHWVHGLWRYVHSPLADSRLAAEYRTLVSDVARFMETRVTAERGWNFGLADGGKDPRGICTMWGPDLYPHEQARLPMIYLAAYEATKDVHWRDLYERYIDEALDKTLLVNGEGRGRFARKMPCYSLYQANASLELIRACETNEVRRAKIDASMRGFAEIAAGRAKASLQHPEVKHYGMCWDGELCLAMLMTSSPLQLQTLRPFLCQTIMRSDLTTSGVCRAAHVMAAYWRARAGGIFTATDGWENIAPDRREVAPAHVVWSADFAAESGFSVEKRDGAEGRIAFADGALTIEKTNDAGLMIVRAKSFHAPTGMPLRLFADAQVSSGDYFHAQAALRAYGKNENLLPCWKLNARYFSMGGAEEMCAAVNSAPGTSYRKYTHYLVGADGLVTPVIVVAGTPSKSVWRNWTAEDLDAADAKWEGLYRAKTARDHSEERMDEAAFDRLIANDKIDHTARLEKVGGVTRLLIDGVVSVPTAYRSKGSFGDDALLETFAGGPVVSNGVRLVVKTVAMGGKDGTPRRYWTKDGFDVAGAVRDIKNALRLAPDALCILGIQCNAYPDFTRVEHPGEVWRLEDGTVVRGTVGSCEAGYDDMGIADTNRWPWVSYASPSWRTAVKANICELLAELKRTGISRRIVGVHLSGYHDGQFYSPFPDYSECAKAEYERFLKESHPIQYDYDSFSRILGFRAQEDFARAFKAALGKDAIAIRWCMGPFIGGQDLTEFAFSDALDIIVPQPTYETRRPGMAAEMKLPFSSFALHGKMYWNELDLRTYGALESWAKPGVVATKGLGQSDDIAMWRTVSRKFVGMMLAHGSGFWLYDMGGGWFSPPEIAQDFGEALRVAKAEVGRTPSAWRPDAALVADEAGLHVEFGGSKSPFSTQILRRQLGPLAASGVPFDFYLAEDALRDHALLAKYKVVVFALFRSIDERRRHLVDALARDGRTIVFLTETGVAGGAAVTGFEIAHSTNALPHVVVPEPGVSEEVASLMSADRRRMFPDGTQSVAKGPRTSVREGADVKVLARFASDGAPALALREEGGCRRVYVCEPAGLSADMFNRLAREAGAYVPVSGGGLQVDMNGNFVSLHALRSGEWDFNLPFPCRAVNLASGRDEQQNGDRLRLALTAGETCWLRLYAKGAE